MKLFLKSFLNLLVCLSLIPSNSLADGIVFDPLVYGEVIASKIAEVEAMGQQLAILTQQLSVVTHQLDSLKQLGPGQYQWSNAQALINNLGSIVQQSNGIAYSAQNIDSQFKDAYPGYQPAASYTKQYQTIVDKTINTINGVLQSIGTSAQDFQNENARLAFLQQQSQNAVGQTQAIQAASQIASEQVSQLQLLRQTIDAQTNAQTTYYAAQIQKEASVKAELDKVIKSGSQEVPAYGTSGHSISPPNL